MLAQGKTACTAIAKAFLETVEKAGYFVGIYSSKSYLESCFTEELRTRYAVWVAHYGVEKTTYHGQYGIWQKSSTGKVSGIRGNVDMNECYTDYPAAIRKKGLNGFKLSRPQQQRSRRRRSPGRKARRCTLAAMYRCSPTKLLPRLLHADRRNVLHLRRRAVQAGR